jgi:hypothetical protein
MAAVFTYTRFAALTIYACLVCPALGSGQTSLDAVPLATSSASSDLPGPRIPKLFESPKPKPTGGGFWAPFDGVPSDFVRFFSADTMKVVGFMGAGALAAHRWDDQAMLESQEHMSPAAFNAGNISGRFLFQVGAGFGLYSVAKFAGSTELASVGADLVRAQILSQGVVQAGKLATRRSRPDGSNNGSLPSGHTAARLRPPQFSSSTMAGRSVFRHTRSAPTSQLRGCRPTSTI